MLVLKAKLGHIAVWLSQPQFGNTELRGQSGCSFNVILVQLQNGSNKLWTKWPVYHGMNNHVHAGRTTEQPKVTHSYYWKQVLTYNARSFAVTGQKKQFVHKNSYWLLQKIWQQWNALGVHPPCNKQQDVPCVCMDGCKPKKKKTQTNFGQAGFCFPVSSTNLISDEPQLFGPA